MVMALVVAIPCAAALLAFRWWLDARPKPTPVGELEQRLRALEDWRTTQELQRVRR